MTKSKFRLNCRSLILTYKSHIDASKFEKFKGFHKIWHELGETGYKHTHCVFYYRKAYDTKNERYFDIGDIHPNIKKILTKTHWKNCVNYDKASKKEGSKFTTVKDTLSGNEFLWNGEARDAIQAHKRWSDVINDSSLEGIVQQHFRWARACFDAKPKFNALGPKDKLTLRPWQKNVLQQLEEQNDRQILWVYDKHGAKGKSWLTDYLLDNYDATMFNSGKIADIARAFQYEEIAIFDLPKSADKDFTPYRAMEMLKDGRIFSPKYESGLKRFKRCKVIVFSNELPDKTKLIADRWNIIDLGDGTAKKNEVPTASLNINEKPKLKAKKKSSSRLPPKLLAKLQKKRKRLLDDISDDSIS